MREGDDALRIEEGDLSQPVASRARAHGVVEREQPRLELRQRKAALRAGELGREEVLLPGVGLHRQRAPVGVPQRGLEGFREALLRVGLHLQPVDDDLDRVLAVAVELRQLVDLVDFAVDAQPHEALRAQLLEEVGLLAFAPRHERGQHHDARALGQREHVVDHLRDALRGEREAVLGAVRLADAREEQAQVVVDLRHRPDGGARVVGGRLLLDRDRGRQPLDQVDVRLLHELQELPRVGRKGFDVAPLPLRIERVEGEGRLPRSGQAGDHHQPVARNVEVDIPEVVRAGAADSDLVHALWGRVGVLSWPLRPPGAEGGPEGQSANIPERSFPVRTPPVALSPVRMSARELRASFSLASIFGLRLFGMFVILPVFALYAERLPGWNLTLVGIALGAYGLTQAILQIPFGWASDRLGRKPVMMAGLVVFGLGSALCALARVAVGGDPRPDGPGRRGDLRRGPGDGGGLHAAQPAHQVDGDHRLDDRHVVRRVVRGGPIPAEG